MYPSEECALSVNRSLLPVLLLGLGLAGCGGGGGGGGGGTPPPLVSAYLDATNVVQILENNAGTTELVFPVKLSGPANGALTINYSTDLNAAIDDATGGASCGSGDSDYVTVKTGQITIASGSDSGSIRVTVCGDAVFEPNEKLTLTITSTTGTGQVGTPASLQGIIVNDDAGGLNDTGATVCSDGNFALKTCPQTSHPAQDAQHGRDSNSLTNSDADGHKGFSFTKLGNDGAALPADAATWSCVRDNVTGLLWENTADQLQFYTWAQAQTHATGFGAVCGVSGWRLPTPQELANLVDNRVARSATSTAVVDQTFFPNHQKAVYWSARDADATGNTTAAWGVDFEYGMLINQSESSSSRVRLVNGTAKASAYQAPVSGTLKDAATGLHWQQCVDGLSGVNCAVGAAQSYTWQAALNRVAAVNLAKFAGYSDWRLPNRNELASIVDHSKSNPALDEAVFVGFPKVGGVTPTFWTSTPYAADGEQAWAVGFKDGEVAFIETTNPRYILMVRGGQ